MSLPPGTGYPPQLQLSIPPSTTSFKRSFEQFGFDLDDSPVQSSGGSDPSHQSSSEHAGSSTTGSIRRENDRNKRARSTSSGMTRSGASGSGTSNSSSIRPTRISLSSPSSSSGSSAPLGRRESTLAAPESPRSPLEVPPRLPTPDIDVDMPDLDGDAGLTLGSEMPTTLDAAPPPVPVETPTSPTLNFPEAYRRSLQRFHAEASPTHPPVLPPLRLVEEPSDEPPRIHIDLPQHSLTIAPEQDEDVAPAVIPFYSHPDPPTLPPIPSADLFPEDRITTSEPVQSLSDHVPPSPSLHELRQWIDEAASPSGDSDSSISGLARSDVADSGTSHVVVSTSNENSQLGWPPEEGITGANLPASVQEFTEDDGRRRRRPHLPLRNSGLGDVVWDDLFSVSAESNERRNSPTLPSLSSASSILGVGGSLLTSSPTTRSATTSRTPSLASLFHRRRANVLWEDDDDEGMDGDRDDEIMGIPESRASSSFPVMSTATRSVESSSSPRPNDPPPSSALRRLELDLDTDGSPVESEFGDVGRSTYSTNHAPSLRSTLRRHLEMGGHSSGEESEANQSSRPQPSSSTFSTMRHSSASTFLPTPPFPRSSDATGNLPSFNRHPNRSTAFRSSSSSLVAETPSESRRRDLARLGLLQSDEESVVPSSSTAPSSNPGSRSRLGPDPRSTSNSFDYNNPWTLLREPSPSSSMGATTGSSVADDRIAAFDSATMMQVDEREPTLPRLQASNPPTINPARLTSQTPSNLSPHSTMADIRNLYDLPNLHPLSTARDQTSRQSNPGPSSTRRTSVPISPGWERELSNYSTLLGRHFEESSSGSSNGNSPTLGFSTSVLSGGRDRAGASSSTRPSSYIPASIPSPSLDLSFTPSDPLRVSEDSPARPSGASGLDRTNRASDRNEVSPVRQSHVPFNPSLSLELQHDWSGFDQWFNDDSEDATPEATGTSAARTVPPTLVQMAQQRQEERQLRNRQRERELAMMRDSSLRETPAQVRMRLQRTAALDPAESPLERQERRAREWADLHEYGGLRETPDEMRARLQRSATLRNNQLRVYEYLHDRAEFSRASASGSGSGVPTDVDMDLEAPINPVLSSHASRPARGTIYGHPSASPATTNAPQTSSHPQPMEESNNNNNPSSTDGSGIASQFTPGPYRNTMRLFEMAAGLNGHQVRPQEAGQRRDLTHPQEPPRRRSPPPIEHLSAWRPSHITTPRSISPDLRDSSIHEEAAPTPMFTRQPRTASLAQYLNSRQPGAGLGRSEGSAPPGAPPPSPQSSSSTIRPTFTINEERLAYLRRRPLLTTQPSSSTPDSSFGTRSAWAPPESSSRAGLTREAAYSQFFDLHPPHPHVHHLHSHHPRPTPTSSSSGPAGASTPADPIPSSSSRRNNFGAEPSRPFSQAIESLREPSSATHLMPGTQGYLSAAEMIRRRRAAIALEDSTGPNGDAVQRMRNRIRFRADGTRRRMNGFTFADFMRDEDFDQSYESLLRLGALVGEAKPRGASSSTVDSLEKAEYKDWATEDSDKRCPICLDDYTPTDPVMKLNHCSHWLHRDCLQQWLQGASTCPVCRKAVQGPAAASGPSRTGPAHIRLRTFIPTRRPHRRADPDSSDTNDDSNGGTGISNLPPRLPPVAVSYAHNHGSSRHSLLPTAVPGVQAHNLNEGSSTESNPNSNNNSAGTPGRRSSLPTVPVSYRFPEFPPSMLRPRRRDGDDDGSGNGGGPSDTTPSSSDSFLY